RASPPPPDATPFPYTTLFRSSPAPGITGRAERADADVRDEFYSKLDELRLRLEAAKPDALIIIAAEHFANFFMNNMPAYCMGMRSEEHTSELQSREKLV